MALFPPSTNDGYAGAPASAWFLMFAAVLEFVPGCIHFFLPDGGAGVIAGLDLSGNRQMTIALFAWVGAVQIPMAAMLFIIALSYRTLVPLGLLILIVERGLMTVDGWFLKGAASGHHPPEHYASPVAVVLALVFLVLSLRGRAARAG